jgi:integrase/recombinase XerD
VSQGRRLREAGDTDTDTDGAPYAKGKIMTASQSASRKRKQLDEGSFQPEISSFQLHLAAEGKAGKTVRTYAEAVQWFAGEYLRRETGLTGWEEVGKQDVQRWVVRLLGRYSSAYATNQYRALQQFFKWLPPRTRSPTRWPG